MAMVILELISGTLIGVTADDLPFHIMDQYGYTGILNGDKRALLAAYIYGNIVHPERFHDANQQLRGRPVDRRDSK